MKLPHFSNPIAKIIMTIPIRQSWYARYYEDKPAWVDADGSRHWVTRGANFVVVVSDTKAGARLQRVAEVDESFVLLAAGVQAQAQTHKETATAAGDSLLIMPPGDSSVTLPGGGLVYRIFSNTAADLLMLADNAATYSDGAPQVTPAVAWPEPVGGYALRVYPLAQYIRPGVFGRLFRTRKLMVNVFPPSDKPRDIRKMTPHAHADYEQGSLALQGRYVHHLRYPWTPDMTTWREDEHGDVGSPSLIIIPPKVVHTSQSMGPPTTQLVDIFSPPRDDFSLVPGQVNNADVYPLPQRLLGTEPSSAMA